MRAGGSRHQSQPWRPVACALLLLLCLCRPCVADPSREYVVKAAFLFNFAQFVEWPADAFPSSSAPLILGTVGPDPFGGALERAVAGKSIKGHPLLIRHFGSAKDIHGCQLLFVCEHDRTEVMEVCQSLGNTPCLAVGEAEGFLDAGGAIRFYLDGNKLRFEINLNAARKARLKISAKLLKLARIYGE